MNNPKIINKSKNNINYRILDKITHNKSCFTQGFHIHDNYLYESCGLYNKSTLNKINLKSNTIDKKINIDKNIFAEGITIYKNLIFLLTYKSQKVLCYDLNLNFYKMFDIQTTTNECWGITHNNKYLIISDGSSKLNFYYFPNNNTKLLKKKKEMNVSYYNYNIHYINELEYVNGYIYANIWYNDHIIKINPKNGKIVNSYNFEYFKDIENTSQNVLNGIAYERNKKIFYITGKNWKNIYKIKLLN